MKTMQAREAKAHFSALLEAAEKGEPTIITRHGKPAAIVVPIEEARKIYPDNQASFVDHLLSFPGGLDVERNESPSREVDL